VIGPARSRRPQWAPYLFLAPFLTAFAVFWAWPIAYSLYLSFVNTRVRPWRFDPGFNWGRLLADETFWNALSHTLVILALQLQWKGLCEAMEQAALEHDPRFADKVVIVTIGGTWCPNCHDEAAFLRDFLPGRRERGLEVVQLLFEYHTEFSDSAAAAREFIAEFAIDYPVLIAGTYEAGAVQRALPQIANFVAYPTMLVLDKQRRIVYPHTGFSGPATGSHYEAFVAEFSTLVDGLLAGS
jgi:thiol-disulfide isomerase/thioredoxin